MITNQQIVSELDRAILRLLKGDRDANIRTKFILDDLRRKVEQRRVEEEANKDISKQVLEGTAPRHNF